MKAPLRKSLALTFSSIIVAVTLGSAFGQAVQVTGDVPESDDLPSPQFAGVKNKRFTPLNWVEVEAKINIQMKPEPVTKTCDKLTVKWYVAVKDRDKPGNYMLLTKDIEHVNVPVGEDVYCSVFISPASLRRITGSNSGGKSAVEYVGYEVLVNGEKVAQGTNKGKAGWWSAASEKISRSEAVPLLNKNETPFRDMWWDRYPEISVERR